MPNPTCPKCGEEFESEDIEAIFAAHDPNFIDITITCHSQECHVVLNSFISLAEFIRLEP